MGLFAKLFGKKIYHESSHALNEHTHVESVQSKRQESSQLSSAQSVKKRQQALKISDDVVNVIEIYQTAEDDLVIASADMRLRELFIHNDNDVHIPLLRQTQLSLKTYQDLATKAQSFDVRRFMIEHLSDSVSLLLVINHNDDIATQILAIEKLGDIEALKVLVKRYQGKKKSLYRSAKERLAIMKSRQEHIDDLQTQCDNLERQSAQHNLTLSAVINAEKNLISLENEIPSIVFHRHLELLAALKNVASEIEKAKNARHIILNELTRIVGSLESNSFIGKRSLFNQQMNQIQQQWIDAPVWNSVEAKGLDIRFEQLIGAANRLANAYFDEKNHKDAQTKIIAQCQKWLDTRTFVTQTMIANQEKRWQQMTPLSEPSQQKLVQVEFESLCAQLQEQSALLETAQINNDNSISALLDELAQPIESGKVKQAESAHTKIRQCLDSDAGLSKAVYQESSGRFKRLENRLRDLQQWQHFGNDHVRQDLIVAMQNLVTDTSSDLQAKADEIQSLQQQWKALKGRAPDDLWEQFKQLGDQAWLPCADYFKEQRQVSKKALTARMDFLTEAERHLDVVDWSAPNWKAVIETYRKFENVWRELPQLQEYDYRKAKKAYDVLMKRWDSYIDAERQREKVRRQQLIEKAEAQHDNEDLLSATATIKELQGQWAPTIGLKRRSSEQALWKRFKSACDDVFEKHHMQRDESNQAMNEAFERHSSQLDDIALLLDDDILFEQKRIKFQEHTENLTIFDGVSEKSTRALQKKLQNITQRFREQERSALGDKRQTYLVQCSQQDQLCIALEREVLESDQVTEVVTQWDAIKPVLTEQQNTMKKRFDAALKMQHNADIPVPENDIISKAQELCIIAEIVADIESPDAFQADREKMRLTMLDKAMNGDKYFDTIKTDKGLYTMIIDWHILAKGSFNQENSGDSLENWWSRFECSTESIRKKI